MIWDKKNLIGKVFTQDIKDSAQALVERFIQEFNRSIIADYIRLKPVSHTVTDLYLYPNTLVADGASQRVA